MKVIMSCLMVVLLFVLAPNFASASDTESENVRTVQSRPNAWCVKGMIKNLERYPINGYVKIKFLNSKGNIVAAHSAPVNNGDYFSAGQAAPFEYFAKPEEFKGVTDYQIIFVDIKY